MVEDTPIREVLEAGRERALRNLRSQALRSSGLLDPEPDPAFDELTHLAATLCNTPSAAVSLVGELKVFLKSRHGIELQVLPAQETFCRRAIDLSEPLVVEDALQDERFADLPLVKCVDGLRFYAGVPLHLADGSRPGMLCVIDVVPRKLTAEQLQALRTVGRQVERLLEERIGPDGVSQRRLASIIEAAPDMVAFTTSNSQLLYLNPAGRRLLGLEEDEQVNAYTLFSFLDEERAAHLRTFALPSAVRDGSWAGETTYQRRDGTPVVATLVIMAHKTQAGELEYFSLTSRDVTQLRQAESELRARENELRHAQKMEAVGKLAGGIAHDFNNLLSAIIGFNELALDKLPSSHEVRPDLEQIRRATKRSIALTRQILAFARKSVLQPRVVNLRDVIGESLRMIDRLIGDDVEVVFTPGPPGVVRVDPSQIEQVLLNLCLNARDAMPEGGRLTISTSQEYLDAEFVREHPGLDPGEHVCLSVSDTGCGMSADVESRVFEPFFTTKGQGKGSGLGLSTVHGIVTQSGGHVWVESEPDVGTTFTICFPLCEEEVDAGGTTRWNSDPGKNETILVAEDDELLRQLIRSVFTNANYHLLLASDGQEALELAEAHAGKIDLFLTDVIMPRLNGVETAHRLLERYPDLQVVCMSGYVDTNLEPKVLELGPFLRKPVTPSQLLSTVRAVLDG